MTQTVPAPVAPSDAPWDSAGFAAHLRSAGTLYHDRHLFHVAMNAGRLAPRQIRGWIANRFCYQQAIPRKDAAILANCPLRDIRRTWIHRLTDHDGDGADAGGIEAWLRLADAAGLGREELLDGRHVVPGVRFAVESYLTLARTSPWPVAIAASLTELFAPDLMAQRIGAFEQHYPWIAPEGLDYFRRRVTQARRDSQEALAITLEHCSTPELQTQAVAALRTKCRILWTLLDAIAEAYGPIPETRP